MRQLFVIATLAFSFSACATNSVTAFGPKTSATDIGFQNTQIEKDRFRVGFTARSDLEAKDYAILRAAQIAEKEGYSHFEILNGDVFGNGPRSPIGASMGIGTSYHGRTKGGIGVDVADIGRVLEGDKVTHMIEVKLINAPGTGSVVYNAKSVIGSIKPAVFK